VKFVEKKFARTALEELAQIAQAIACCERCPLYISRNDAYSALIAGLKRAKRLGEGERKAVKA
jgi:hypothetical protein